MQLFKRIEPLLDFSLSVVPITTFGKEAGREGDCTSLLNQII